MSATRLRLGLLVAATLLASSAAATTIIVTAASDDVVLNGNCTLREALWAAIDDEPRDACPAGSPAEADEILLPTAAYAWQLGTVDVPAGALTLRGPAAEPHSSLAVQSASRFLRVYGGSSVTIENLVVAGGDATLDGVRPYGGAITVEGGTLTLRRTTFSGGYARGGGAVAYQGGAGESLRIENGAFYGTVAATGASGPAEAEGGALRIVLAGDARAEILGTIFLGAEARGGASGPTARGGALHVQLTDDSELVLRGGGFGGNRVLTAGIVEGGAVYVEADGASRVTVSDTHVNGGSALGGDGEAIALVARGISTVRLERAELATNCAGSTGNQLSVWAVEDAHATLANLIVASCAGGGVKARAAGSATLLLGHLTITGQDGVGLDQLATEGGLLRTENSILWNNGIDVAGPGVVDPSCLVNVDPLFVDPADFDFRLGPGSPAIDFGDRTLATVGSYDRGHAPRVVGAETDPGALERGAIFGDGFETADARVWSGTQP